MQLARTSLLFATGNKGKLVEAQTILAGLGITVISSADLPQVANLDVPETGATYAENAAQKAQAYGRLSGLLTCADDSGIEVAALNNEPGIHSARWVEGSEIDRIQALLQRMEGVIDRRARFMSVIALYDPATEAMEYFRGEIAGTLATEPRGTGGFGYDPLLIPVGLTETFGQLGEEVKNTISHRYKALKSMAEYLRQEIQ